MPTSTPATGMRLASNHCSPAGIQPKVQIIRSLSISYNKKKETKKKKQALNRKSKMENTINNRC